MFPLAVCVMGHELLLTVADATRLGKMQEGWRMG